MIVCVANIDRLKNFSFIDEDKTWFFHYIHANTGKLLEIIDMSDLIDYMHRLYENGIDLKIDQKISLNDRITYRVVQIVDKDYNKRRITEIIII